MRTQTLNIGNEYGAEYAGKYVFQEITWAKRNRIIQKHTKYHPLSGQVQASDFIAIQAETIRAALKEQPPNSPITLEKLLSEENGIPIPLGELFSQVVNGLCALTREEQSFLSEPSDAKNPTLPSPTFGSAKNSAGLLQNSPNNLQDQSTNTSSSSTR
ncbi:MAG: hypothetical protein NWE98_00405 [Candidatus Bathyarchaeota archaeon]|nr:hypothetical protein [Candidatus Bathyarchaeota archaeon]